MHTSYNIGWSYTRSLHLNPLGPIIFVDHSPAERLIAQICYHRSTIVHPFIVMTSGEELLDHLDAVDRGDSIPPALVVLGANLPRLGGLRVLNLTRSRPSFAQEPVIIVLTNSRHTMGGTSIPLGASRLLPRPMTARQHVRFFATLLGTAEAIRCDSSWTDPMRHLRKALRGEQVLERSRLC